MPEKCSAAANLPDQIRAEASTSTSMHRILPKECEREGNHAYSLKSFRILDASDIGSATMDALRMSVEQVG